jgi:siroheme synthase (precorrin-2 oxidase/ferrochelatase)
LGEGGLAEAKVVAVVVVVGGGKEAATTAAAAASTTAIVVVVVGISSTDHCFRWGELLCEARVSADRDLMLDLGFS